MTIKVDEEKARKRMAVILQVEAGLMTATAGARMLGISRQAFYEWQERAREAMMISLADRPGGRPAEAKDEEKERLEKELAQTKAELEEAITALDIKRTLEELRREQESSHSSGPAAKKNTCRNRAERRRSVKS